MDEITQIMMRYGALMDAGVKTGTAEGEALAGMYDADYIASSPQGLMTGKQDGKFGSVIADGITHYRRTGATAFVVKAVRPQRIDDMHAIAAVDWRFDYRRKADGKTGTIVFTNHYLLRRRDGAWKIFGWMTPDEQAAMEEHGLA